MNKAIVGVVIVIILAVGGWVWHDHKNSSNNYDSAGNTNTSASTSNSSNQSSQATNEGKITIQNMMFTPSQITVAKDGTVTWTNNGTTAHRVVDDLSNVDGPDSGSIAPGQTYSFTFNKSGSFQYHDSLHTSMRGTIVVK